MNPRPEPLADPASDKDDRALPSWPEVPPTTNVQLDLMVQHHLTGPHEPEHALGRLEALAMQLARIQQPSGHGLENLRFESPQLVVFAADHGLAAQGVSAYPSDVTWQMVSNFLAGGAAVSVLARQHGLALTVVDCGVRHDFAPRPGLLSHKLAPGTADALEGPAMSAAHCAQAIANGREVLQGLPGNALLLGEMGIGNTSSASLLLARLCGISLDDCTGAGTGAATVASSAFLAATASGGGSRRTGVTGAGLG